MDEDMPPAGSIIIDYDGIFISPGTNFYGYNDSIIIDFSNKEDLVSVSLLYGIPNDLNYFLRKATGNIHG